MWTRPSTPGKISTMAPKSKTLFTFPKYNPPTSTSWVNRLTMAIASSTASMFGEAILTRPESSTSILTPVSSIIVRMFLPPGPITSRILSGLTSIVMIRGAWTEISFLGSAMTSFIFSRMWSLPSRAWERALSSISRDMPGTLMSIWSAVTPFSVPATLKSMSPRWSSSPKMSDRISIRSPSFIRPMAIPATAAFTGTPASIRERLPPHTVAIEDEPFDSKTSETTLMVYGKSSLPGRTGMIALSARAPWPTSLLLGALSMETSPTQNGGKL